MKPTFLTVPEELLEVAERAHDHWAGYGYSVAVEAASLEYPYTPTLRCKRGSTTVFVEVGQRIDIHRLREWNAYGRSCRRDTRVVMAVPESAEIDVADLKRLREEGTGLVQIGVSVTELVEAGDLAVNMGLPSLKGERAKVRTALGPAFEQIDRGDWREGFEDACIALEQAARRYLNSAISAGRVRCISSAGNDITPTATRVNKAPMGALKDHFASIANPNHADSVIADGLKRINADRIRVAHNRRQARAEQALRDNVGRDIWVIFNVMRELLA